MRRALWRSKEGCDFSRARYPCRSGGWGLLNSELQIRRSATSTSCSSVRVRVVELQLRVAELQIAATAGLRSCNSHSSQLCQIDRAATRTSRDLRSATQIAERQLAICDQCFGASLSPRCCGICSGTGRGPHCVPCVDFRQPSWLPKTTMFRVPWGNGAKTVGI